MAATWGMARRPRTDRQQKLKQQQARVAAARRELDELSRCDCCGVQVPPNGAEEQLCFSCFKQRREQARVELLARSGYGPDGRRLAAA
jgi:multidrug efflux pump subunit AcrA (membrane-fusion protein)